LSTIADKLAVTELLYRYAELIDAGDFDGVGQLLARATFAGTRSRRSRAAGDIQPGTSGAEAIAKLFAMTTRRYPDHGNTPRTRHLVLNPIVDIDNRTATAPVHVLRHPEHRDGAAAADRRRPVFRSLQLRR
jgi:SnoaL-like domain